MLRPPPTTPASLTLLVSPPAWPQVSEIQVLSDRDASEEALFAIHIENFYPKWIHEVHWSWDGEGAGMKEHIKTRDNPDGTFTAMSIWKVPRGSLSCPDLQVQVSV